MMPKVISFHVLHDANVSIMEDGKLIVVLELERLFEQRYFCSNPRKNIFIDQWKQAIDLVTSFTNLHQFDVGITSWVMPTQVKILQSLVKAERWITVDHHLAHAALGFYDSPFNKSLIFSYDGGGNDGTFNVYFGDRKDGIRHLRWVGLNLGTPFRQLAIAMPEVTGKSQNAEETKDLTTYMRFAALALSGKVMGYAALGKIREGWISAFEEYYRQFISPLQAMYTLGEKIGLVLEPNSLSNEDARDVAATSQHVFENLLCEQVAIHMNMKPDEGTSYQEIIDGIVLTGGCALNVHANELVFEKFALPVHVPSAPNDCGISVGAAWAVDPPKNAPEQVQYAGLPLFDHRYLQGTAVKRGARMVDITEVTDEFVEPGFNPPSFEVRGNQLSDDIARILVEEKVAIGVVTGRQEFGPRALGHRSVLCYPNCKEVKDELNRFKSREWFRPLCPSVTIECSKRMYTQAFQIGDTPNQRVTGHVPESPYMSFAPKLKEEVKDLFPAICHFDGTSRLQTVREDDEPWYHQLLCEVGKLNGGYEILLNTSFNVKLYLKIVSAVLGVGQMALCLLTTRAGKPILNRLSTALEILDSAETDLFKYVLIEDFLFTKCKDKVS